MAFHTNPSKKAKKQVELLLPNLGPIPSLNSTFLNRMGLRMSKSIFLCFDGWSMTSHPWNPFYLLEKNFASCRAFDVLTLLKHHVKKGNTVVVMMGLDQNLFPSQQALLLLSVYINNITSFHIEVGVVINDYHHLRGGGGGTSINELLDSHVGCTYNDCNVSMICVYHEQITSVWQ